jgi:hypothetical protein
VSQKRAIAPRDRYIHSIFVGQVMHALVARDVSDRSACPACGTLIAEPKSSDYLGLGRIEHSWRCEGCGEAFRTTARMAGMVEVEPQASIAAAR